MKYMLLVYMNELAMSDDERQQCYVDSAQLTQDLHVKGQYLDAAPLHPVATATSPPPGQSRSCGECDSDAGKSPAHGGPPGTAEHTGSADALTNGPGMGTCLSKDRQAYHSSRRAPFSDFVGR